MRVLSNSILRGAAVAGMRKAELADFAAPQVAKARAEGEAALEAKRRAEESAAAARAAELEQAREEGRRAGAQAARTELDSVLEREREDLRRAMQGLQSLMRDLEQRLAGDVLGMSLEVARLVLREHLRVKPDILLAALREGVESLPSLSEQVTLVVHPADAQMLRALSGDERILPVPWKIVEDAQTIRGGFRLETSSTEVDGSMEMRWQRVIAALGRDDAWD